MMKTAPSLFLTREQAGRLMEYMQEYRGDALMTLPPTGERNTTLRLVQALQGKLLSLYEQEGALLSLALEREEVVAFRTMLRSLLMRYGEEPMSVQRTRIITDLGNLYAQVKQTYG